MISKTEVYEILKHPLLLLIATALITHYLFPRITQRWQDHKKEMELKVAFVGQIIETVLDFFLTIQYAEFGIKISQEEYDKSYRNWETQRTIIGLKVRLNFLDPRLGAEWNIFSEMVTEVYMLSGTSDPTFRKTNLSKLSAYLTGTDVDWEGLESLTLKGDAMNLQKFSKSWFELKAALLQRFGDFNQHIMRSDMTMFR